MIITTNNEEFSFINDKGNKETVPAGTKVYVHVSDNGNGRHEIHGKIISETNSELGWQRIYDEENKTASLPSNTVDLLKEAESLVTAKLEEVNPNVEFISTI